MKTKYVIGIDFGTLSGRAVLVEADTGKEIATAIELYSHGVIDKCLLDGRTKLGLGWALQHPWDYLDVLREVVPKVLRTAQVDALNVIGIGIDFTSCTVLPIDKMGTPLCFYDEYSSNPHAYAKLWKHHGAQDEANELNRIANERGESFLKYYGGKVSSESLIPKIWETLNDAPDIYDKADKFIEAGDWIVLQLTGVEKRSSCAAGFKSLWNKEMGFPSREFFKALDPRLENVVDNKLGSDYFPVGYQAGELTRKAAELTGLRPGTSVAVACVDAHAGVPGAGITEEGQMLMIMGTSTCYIVHSSKDKAVPGVFGIVEDGIIPGLFCYEAGQSGVGDCFGWFIKNSVPANYGMKAEEKGISIHEILSEKAGKLKPGDSGLIALDWWNGNRSVLANADLSGVIIGLTLLTTPEEIYRALLEATAFGTKMIIENYEQSGIPIREIYAAGGIAENEIVMQIYADITNKEIKVSASSQTSAFGAAIFGAIAASSARGGYDSLIDAVKTMVKPSKKCYRPVPENIRIYNELYDEYKKLHDYFGRGANDVLATLNRLKTKN